MAERASPTNKGFVEDRSRIGNLPAKSLSQVGALRLLNGAQCSITSFHNPFRLVWWLYAKLRRGDETGLATNLPRDSCLILSSCIHQKIRFDVELHRQTSAQARAVPQRSIDRRPFRDVASVRVGHTTRRSALKARHLLDAIHLRSHRERSADHSISSSRDQTEAKHLRPGIVSVLQAGH